ncbi:hypothetical protein DSECCO2_605520 [anaerobic digester metagenome]
MPHAKMVVRAFCHARKAGNAAKRSQGVKILGAPGQQLVGVGLMPHVPDELVVFHIKGRQQGQRQLNHAQRGRKMPAVA